MTKEEKLQRLLEMQEHPECYTDEEIRQLMADEECRQLYEQMVRATDAVYAEKVKATPQSRRWLRVVATLLGVLMLSGIAYAAYRVAVGGNLQAPTEETRISESQQQDNQTPSPSEGPEEADSIHIFSNAPLDELAGELATYYNKVADIRSAQAHELRLYYKWERKDKLEDVINDLNHFDHVSLTVEGDKLIVNP